MSYTDPENIDDLRLKLRANRVMARVYFYFLMILFIVFLGVFFLLVNPAQAGVFDDGIPNGQEQGAAVLVLGAAATTQLEPDKQLHAYMGFIFSGFFTVGSENGYLGAAVACGAGLFKEVYDHNRGGTVEREDFAATCGAGVLTAWSIRKIQVFNEYKKYSLVPVRRGRGARLVFNRTF